MNTTPRHVPSFDVLVEQSLVGVYIVQDGRLVYANPKLGELFGYAAAELLALPSALALVADEDRSVVEEMLRRRLEGEVESVRYAWRGRRRDGSAIDLEVLGSRCDFDRRPAVSGTMIDVTDQRRRQRELEAREARLLLEVDELRSLAIVDDLTGLYNRRGFLALAERHLKLAMRRQRGVFLLFCDLDRLKAINDQHGHKEGDRALRDTAEVLRASFRSADIIARLGGDEFTVFPLEASDESGDLLIQRLAERVDALNASGTRPYRLGLSVGIARFEPGSAWTIEQLLDEADRRLYKDKRSRTAGSPGSDQDRSSSDAASQK